VVLGRSRIRLDRIDSDGRGLGQGILDQVVADHRAAWAAADPMVQSPVAPVVHRIQSHNLVGMVQYSHIDHSAGTIQEVGLGHSHHSHVDVQFGTDIHRGHCLYHRNVFVQSRSLIEIRYDHRSVLVQRSCRNGALDGRASRILPLFCLCSLSSHRPAHPCLSFRTRPRSPGSKLASMLGNLAQALLQLCGSCRHGRFEYQGSD